MRDIDIDIDQDEDTEIRYAGPIYTSCRCNLCGEIVTGYVDKREDNVPFVCGRCKADMRNPVGARRFDPKEIVEEDKGLEERNEASDDAELKDTGCSNRSEEVSEEQRHSREIRRLIESRKVGVNEFGMAGNKYLPVSSKAITTATKATLLRWVKSGRISEARYRIEMRRRASMEYYADCLHADKDPMKRIRF